MMLMKTSLALMMTIVSMLIIINMDNTGAAAATVETYNLLCKQATIDAIAYAEVQKMFWITSGSNFWYFNCDPECMFPKSVSDGAVIELPTQMPTVDAAVYIDSQTTCHKSKQTENGKGINVNEHRIWTVRLWDNGTHNLLPMEAMSSGNRWSIDKLQDYSKEHCISKADIEWTSGQPVNAMFAVNNLYLYFLMGDRLAMVNCSYVCIDHIHGEGTGMPWIPVKDWLQTDEKVYSMFTINSAELFVFFKDYYQIYTIDTKTVDDNGYVNVSKRGDKLDIHKDFLKIENPVDCPSNTTSAENSSISSNDKTDGHSQSVADSKDDDSGGSMVWLWIVIVVIVIVVVLVVCCLVFLMSRKKSKSGDKQQDSAAMKTPKQSPKTSAKSSASSPAARKLVTGGANSPKSTKK